MIMNNNDNINDNPVLNPLEARDHRHVDPAGRVRADLIDEPGVFPRRARPFSAPA